MFNPHITNTTGGMSSYGQASQGGAGASSITSAESSHPLFILQHNQQVLEENLQHLDQQLKSLQLADIKYRSHFTNTNDTETKNRCRYYYEHTLTRPTNALQSDIRDVENALELIQTTIQTHQFDPSAPFTIPLATHSPSSKYAKIHDIIFQVDGKADIEFELDHQAYEHHARAKGISMDVSYVDTETLTEVNPTLKAKLSEIPVDDQAAVDTVKHTKITINGHGGTETQISVKSPYRDHRQNVSAENIAAFLATHLRAGNYHGKLTITMRSCYAGTALDRGYSVIDKITDHLADRGYEGIKITGPDDKISYNWKSTKNVPLGGAKVGTTIPGLFDSETEVKVNNSRKKEMSYI